MVQYDQLLPIAKVMYKTLELVGVDLTYIDGLSGKDIVDIFVDHEKFMEYGMWFNSEKIKINNDVITSQSLQKIADQIEVPYYDKKPLDDQTISDIFVELGGEDKGWNLQLEEMNPRKLLALFLTNEDMFEYKQMLKRRDEKTFDWRTKIQEDIFNEALIRMRKAAEKNA